MSETPFDPTEADHVPAETFREAIRDAYMADDDLTPFEALGVLELIRTEIVAAFFEGESEDDEGDLED